MEGEDHEEGVTYDCDGRDFSQCAANTSTARPCDRPAPGAVALAGLIALTTAGQIGLIVAAGYWLRAALPSPAPPNWCRDREAPAITRREARRLSATSRPRPEAPYPIRADLRAAPWFPGHRGRRGTTGSLRRPGRRKLPGRWRTRRVVGREPRCSRKLVLDPTGGRPPRPTLPREMAAPWGASSSPGGGSAMTPAATAATAWGRSTTRPRASTATTRGGRAVPGPPTATSSSPAASATWSSGTRR